MNQDFRNSARSGFMHYFLEIAAESFVTLKESSNKLEQLQKEFDWYQMERNGEIYNVQYYLRDDEVTAEEKKIEKESIKIIIFLATYLEAYIWDLSAIVHGDNYSKKYLDKMDLISKWVIIPKLITGKEIDRSKRFFEKFKELIKLRNDFIHHKTKSAMPLIRALANFEYIEPLHKQIDVSEFITMIKELFAELNRIDPKGHHLLKLEPFFEIISSNNTQEDI